MNYYVFRVDYDEQFSFIRAELLQGRLRQGWGGFGMDIRNSLEDFLAARVNNRGAFSNSKRYLTRDYHIGKYYNLRKMLKIEIGDLIVIPKLSVDNPYVGNYFTVVRCTKEYDFYVPANVGDFGHIIGVEILFSCPYDFNFSAQTISGKFQSYRSSLNHVWKKDFQDAADKLVESTSDFFSNKIENALNSLTDLEETIRNNGKNIFGDGKIFWNSYPYGVPSDEIFPRFHAICFGEDSLSHVLKIILEQCDRMITHFGDKAEKIVILETDKWDEIIFSDFKRTFENLAEKFNIKFKFRFFTEDGKKIVWFAP